MRTSDKTLMEQLRLTNHEIARRKEYFDITEDDSRVLLSLRDSAVGMLDEIVDEFYTGLLLYDEFDRIIGDSETLIRLKNHFRSYLLTLFDGQFDEEYVHSRLRIGVVHRRIGVRLDYYISAVHLLGSVLQRHLLQDVADIKGHIQGCQVLQKILMFDLSLTVDTYIHSLMDESRRNRDKLEEYAESLEETVAERTRLLNEQARCDSLTGLLNQRTFFTELRKELSRGKRQGYAVTLLYFDIDGFKNINDTKGHRAGDTLLEKVADAARQTTREEELIARYGGDEFCIILPHSTLEEGKALARRLCKEVSRNAGIDSVSLSIGMAASTPLQFYDAESLVKMADSAMYRAKEKAGFWIEAADDEKAA